MVAPIDGLASASPTVAAAPAPAPAVTGLVTRVLDAVLDPSAAGGPVLPVDSPLDWTLLAFARRGSAAALGAIPSAHDIAAPAATASTGLVMGPSGVPIPSQTYVTNVMKLYVTPNSPAGTQALVVFTPEGLYPITGVKSLPLNTSVDQGGEILSETLAAQIGLGNRATIFGYSQSAIIASLLAENLDPSVPVNLVLVGNEMNPNGGFLSRFPNLTMPSLGIDFYGATPNNTVPVTNYTLEYDGFADFPKYPLNFLADLNAGLGIVFVHTKYADLNQAQVQNAIPLTTLNSATQHYYVIPTENLPLLDPLRMIPVIGTPIADLLQPALKVLVNLGYGDPAYGWSNNGYADVQTTFGLFPDVKIGVVLQDLAKGVVAGIQAFVDDLRPGGSVSQDLSSIASSLSGHASLTGSPIDNAITVLQNVITKVANAITTATASLYAALLPTADIVNAFLTTLPAYDVNLFLDGIKQVLSGQILSGLVNAIGLPVAADVGLGTTAGLVGVLVWLQALLGVTGKETDT